MFYSYIHMYWIKIIEKFQSLQCMYIGDHCGGRVQPCKCLILPQSIGHPGRGWKCMTIDYLRSR